MSSNQRDLDLLLIPSSPVLVDEAIYPYGRMMMCHMMSKDLEALHSMADKIGVSRRWFQNKQGRAPHYDICKSKRAFAVKLGAVESNRNEIVEVIRHFRRKLSHDDASC